VSMDLSTVAFYKPGSADFREEMLPALTELAAALKTGAHADYRIEVEGYTSDVPVEGYPSNWEFSAVRAAHMVRFLIAQGIDPDRLSAIGYGSTQALVPNSDQDGQPILENRAKNERVIIKLEKAL
jgi:chemotaxis protein MotB